MTDTPIADYALGIVKLLETVIWDDLGMDLNADERFPGYRFPAVIIGEVVWLRYRFNLSLRDIPALLARSGIVLSHETVRKWCETFGPAYARQVLTVALYAHHRVALGAADGGLVATRGSRLVGRLARCCA